MKISVVSKGFRQVAEAIEQGAFEAGALESVPEEADLVFVNASETADLSQFKGRKIAAFFVKAFPAFLQPSPDKVFSKAHEEGLDVVNTLTLTAKGVSRSLSEENVARAKAFGERTVRNLTGVRPEKSSDKRRIKGYLK